MKAILFMIALIAGSQAFARDCTPYFVSDNFDTSVGYWVSPCGGAVPHRSCIEGEVGYFPIYLISGDINPSGEARVCHNGTFFPEYDPGAVRHLSCIEGEVTYRSIPHGDGYRQVPMVCHDGHFIRR